MMANFFQSMGQFMANTTLPLFVDSLGASASIVGAVVGSFAAAAIIIRPFAGPAFDSFSKKRLLLIAQGIICVAMLLYSIADSVVFVLCARLLHGIGIGCAAPLSTALASEFLPEGKMASGISIYALAQTLAQVISPAVGLWLVDTVGFSVAYVFGSACLLSAMIGVAFLKEVERERLPYQLRFNRMFAREALGKALVLFLFAMPFNCMMVYIVLYGNLRGIANIGLFFTVYALCVFATRPLFGKMADRWGGERILLIGAASYALSFIALFAAHDLVGLVVVAVLGSAGFGACMPLLQSLALSSVPPDRRGAASNTVYIGLDLGMLIGPVIGGSVIELLEGVSGSLVQAYAMTFLVMLVPLALAVCVIVRWNFKKRR